MTTNVPLRQLEEASEFPYSPLDDKEGHIRTLTILPELKQGKLQCRLRHAVIGVSGYVCLSYTWGPNISRHEILLDDRPITVRNHLYNFLQTARQRLSDVNVWIDALSINQLDSEEKNNQVAQMGSIYRNANVVIVWLGNFPELDPILNFDKELLGIYINRLNEDEEREENDMYEHPDREPLLKDRSRETIAVFRALWQLKKHQYLKRAWIYQEIALARQLFIWTATGEISRQMLGAIHMLIGDEYDLVEDMLSNDATLEEEFGSESMNESKTLHLLMHSHDSENGLLDATDWMVDTEVECEDPRDRIYAVRELVPSLNEFRVDYTEELPSLFFRICNHLKLWWTGRDLHLLKLWKITLETMLLDDNNRLVASIPINLGPPVIDQSWRKPNGAVLKCQLCHGSLGSAQVCLSIYRTEPRQFRPRSSVTNDDSKFDFLGCLESGDLSMPWSGHVYIGKGHDGHCSLFDGWWSVGTRSSIPSRNFVVLSQLVEVVTLTQDPSPTDDPRSQKKVKYPKTDEQCTEMEKNEQQYRLIISKTDILERLFFTQSADEELNHDVEFRIKQEEDCHRQLKELVAGDPTRPTGWTLGQETREIVDAIHAHDQM